MSEYVALLRGINVGGVRVAMADLRDTFSHIGFHAVSTVLNTGNVRFRADERPLPELRAQIESALRDRFEYDAFAFVHDAAHIGAVTDAYPFAEIDGRHAYVVFVADDDVHDELLASATVAGAAGTDGPAAKDTGDENEYVRSGNGVVYWSVPRGITLTSPFGKLLSKPRHKATTTNRNLRTLRKILA